MALPIGLGLLPSYVHDRPNAQNVLSQNPRGSTIDSCYHVCTGALLDVARGYFVYLCGIDIWPWQGSVACPLAPGIRRPTEDVENTSRGALNSPQIGA